MNLKDFKEAAKFTVEKGGDIYFFVGVLQSKVGMAYADEEFEKLFSKMVENGNK